MSDQDFMRAALAMARRGLGQTAPNPSVGCIIVKQGRVVGRGFTSAGGRPHAEVNALAQAGNAARGGTAYVTLEPCNFTGKSGPCTEALIQAGISRVVLGAQDPHPKVNGAGIARLRAAGISVSEGVLAAECEASIAGFAMVQRQGRPLLRLKLASSLDGRIATAKGEAKWITGEPARQAAHMLRGTHDAIMVGVGTVLEDDPELTCRIEGYRRTDLVRVVVDSHLRTPLLSKLVRGAARHPLWILHRNGADKLRAKALVQAGVKLIELPAASIGVDLVAAMKALAQNGLTSVLAEGGGTLAAALLRANLVDRLSWFHAPCVIGGDGLPAAQAFGIASLAQMPRFTQISSRRLGADMLTDFIRQPV
ncbi:bifunctional diaminohydroxyphosphoribosylaminopyrimidine deaminase/5-amino-6-(5-phosphoribosylamino)uracil reductase RibD [Acidocella facilis]|uniref:bifunctional diaminohydroxyphosphoribosylaminopyrimidine deaminase/5-amino-6-(5-phosphoribosylamino)uracil reductase RibD n=1 Tax=Acidocella facilis TaxID=525 RepID=UPI00047DD29E|nr:bifunctional diaminohydroxyphosphoribosylaminopyrimidine deaminase/5-amino-6-(5-phosphoribosylamino)uracil reductase RibD [Acidocella facilis]